MQLWPDSNEMKSWCCCIAQGIREASCFIQSLRMNLTDWISWSDQQQDWKALSLGSILWSICITASTNMIVEVLYGIQILGWWTAMNIICFTVATCSIYIVFLVDIYIDKMESEQYLLVMKGFFMQNKFQTLIQPYLVPQTIQSDTLTNHFCTRWTGWQEAIYKLCNIAAD